MKPNLVPTNLRNCDMSKIELTPNQKDKLDQLLQQIGDSSVKDYLLGYFQDGELPDQISDEDLSTVISYIHEVTEVAYVSLKHITTGFVTPPHELSLTTRKPGQYPLYANGVNPTDYIHTESPFLGTLVTVSVTGTPPGQVYLRNGPLALFGAKGFAAKEEFISVEYLYLYLKTNEVYLGNKSSGTIVKNIKRKYLADFKIPILPKDKQQEVVGLLMPMVQNQNGIKQATEQAVLQKKVLLDAVFKKLSHNHFSNPEGTEALKTLSSESQLNELCAALNIDTSELSTSDLQTLLNALIDYRDHKGLSTFEILAKQKARVTETDKARKQLGAELEDLFRCFCSIIQNIEGTVDLPLTLAGRLVSMKLLKQSDTTPGDEVAHWLNGIKPSGFISYDEPHFGAAVIVSRLGANAGSINFWEGPKLSCDNITFEPRELITNGRYLYLAAKLKEPKLKSLARGTGVAAIQPGLVRETIVPVPNLQVQNQLADDLWALEEYVALLTKQDENLQQLFSYHLKKCFEAYTADARALASNSKL